MIAILNGIKEISQKRRHEFRDGVEEFLMLLPALILLVVFLVVPFLMSFQLSLTNQRLIQGPVAAKFIGIRNFVQIMTDREYWQAFGNIGYFTLLVVPIQCGTALALAFFLNRIKVMKNFLRAIYFMPFITPITVVCVVWATFYQYPYGIFNSILGFISGGTFNAVDWLGTKASAMPAVVFLSSWASYGFQMVIYLAGLQNIPEEGYEAAETFGANGWQKFRYVTWPYLRNTNIFVLTITTIQAMKLFTQVNILTHGGPVGTTNTLVHYMYEKGFVAQKIGYASATSVLIFVLVLIIVLIQRYLLGLSEE